MLTIVNTVNIIKIYIKFERSFLDIIVNFFAMSWRQVETDVNAQESFSMRSFMRGNRIRYSAELDPSSSPTEAYLRTTGWSNYVNVWYLYFRKVNFPADPEIHGRWEWAGIYYGEKL